MPHRLRSLLRGYRTDQEHQQRHANLLREVRSSAGTVEGWNEWLDGGLPERHRYNDCSLWKAHQDERNEEERISKRCDESRLSEQA